MKFRTLLADPPWAFDQGYGDGRHVASRTNGKGGPLTRPDGYYACVPTSEMATWPIGAVADTPAALLMWSTWAHLPEALSLIAAWGFTYKTCVPWVKMTQATAPKRGFGFHVANCSEPLLVATRGEGIAPGPGRIGVIFHPAGEHSAKPCDQYAIAERYPGPYLELFARPWWGMLGPRPGWVFLGNEVTGNDIRDDLASLARDEVPAGASADAPPAPAPAQMAMMEVMR